MIVKDNFLDKKDLTQLDELLMSHSFPWYLQKEQVAGAADGGWFCHIIYDEDVPKSDVYNQHCCTYSTYNHGSLPFTKSVIFCYF